MVACDGRDLTERPGGRRTFRPRRAPLVAALLALLVLCCLFGAAAPAGAAPAHDSAQALPALPALQQAQLTAGASYVLTRSGDSWTQQAGKGAKPAKPTAKAPKGIIATTTPTFTWSKVAGAAKYELRVYKGSKLLLKKTGITKPSWRSSKALPKNVGLTWKVRATSARGLGAWSKSLTFKVVTGDPAKAITAFSFASPPVTGVITEADHTIALTVPFGTDVSALVATFTTTGASVAVGATPQVSGTTPNDFSSPVTYTVTAADGTTQAYVVTVTVTLNPAKAITAFSFASPPVTGVITEADHTIALTVPFGTDVSALVATFTTTGASVAVGATPQVSGTTPNDFSSPVTYTVTAADGTTQAYTVTVTVTPLAIGDSYQGGKVAYIFQPADPGYVAGRTSGLIAATADQSTALRWSNGSLIVTGAAATALGSGSANTTTIITAQGATTTSYAAGLAQAYNGGGYADWYLPSKDELDKLYLNKAVIGGFDLGPGGDSNWGSGPYWSSSEVGANYAWAQYFSAGVQHIDWKFGADYRVRAVRTFPADPANKAITAFRFSSPAVTGVINETLHTIAVAVPFGTDVSALVPTITITGASVSPASGVAGNFTSPVTYTVTAADASTQAYVVTVTVTPLAIGDSYQGGKVAYIDGTGQHGLIAAAADQALYTQWSNIGSTLVGTTGAAIGTGQANTTAIVGQAGCTSGAAYVCDHLVEGGYSDWYLPSKDELNQLYLNRAAIGGFASSWPYWTSSEYGATGAWTQTFDTGFQGPQNKLNGPNVRAVRSF